MKKSKVLFDDDEHDDAPTKSIDDRGDRDDGAGNGLKVNARFARQYEERERIKLLAQSRARGWIDDDDGSGDDDDSSASGDEDEREAAMQNALADDKLDTGIARMIGAIRRRDPRIYDSSVQFFGPADTAGGAAPAISQASMKPMKFKDVLREQLLAADGDATRAVESDEERDRGEDENDAREQQRDERQQSLAYDEEQRSLRTAFLDSLGPHGGDSAQGEQGEGDDTDEDDDVLQLAGPAAQRVAPSSELARAVSEMKSAARKRTGGEKVAKGNASASGTDDRAADRFLSDYLLNRRWVEETGGNDEDDDDVDEDDDDEDGVDDDDDDEEEGDAGTAGGGDGSSARSKVAMAAQQRAAKAKLAIAQAGGGADDGASFSVAAIHAMNEEEDEKHALFDDEVDAFESRYNFRYEELAAQKEVLDERAARRRRAPTGGNVDEEDDDDDDDEDGAAPRRRLGGDDAHTVVTHAREIAGSVRRSEDKRKKARELRKERKEAERKRKEDELRHLKNLKRQQLTSQLSKVNAVAGGRFADETGDEIDETRAAALLAALEGDYDPETFDAKMAETFGDDYYNEDDPQNEWRPSDDADAGADADDGDDGDDGDEAVAWGGEDEEDGEGEGDDDGYGYDGEDYGDEDYGDEDATLSKQAKALALAKAKVVEEELYALDYEDLIGETRLDGVEERAASWPCLLRSPSVARLTA